MTITPRVRDELLGDGGNASSALRAGEDATRATRTPANSRWSEWEHERFLEAVKLFPEGPWNRIAEYIGSKNRRQVMSHAQKYRQRLERRRKRQRTLERLQSRPSKVAAMEPVATTAPVPADSPAASVLELARDATEAQLIEVLEAAFMAELPSDCSESNHAESEASQVEPSLSPLPPVDAAELSEFLGLPDYVFADFSSVEDALGPLAP